MKKILSLALICLLIQFNLIATELDPSLIYIQQAKSATLEKSPKGCNYFTLEVFQNEPTVVYFSDKPDRAAGMISLTQFLKVWSNDPNMQSDHPICVMSYVNFTPKVQTGVSVDVLELYNPKYNEEKESVIFEAKSLHDYDVLLGDFEEVVIVYDGLPK